MIETLLHFQEPPFVYQSQPWTLPAGRVIVYTRIITPNWQGEGQTQYQVAVIDTDVARYAADQCDPGLPEYHYEQTAQTYPVEARALLQ